MEEEWRETVSYAVSVFSFLIRGEGEMSGRKFAKVILDYCANPVAKVCANEVKKHVTTIVATHKGTRYGIV